MNQQAVYGNTVMDAIGELGPKSGTESRHFDHRIAGTTTLDLVVFSGGVWVMLVIGAARVAATFGQ